MSYVEAPKGQLSEREQRILDLVLERAGKSNLYKKLGDSQRKRFEEATLAVVGRTLDGADLGTIKHAWRKAMDDSGAEALLLEMKDGLVAEFHTKGQAVIPAIRNSARDVLYVLSDPKNFGSTTEVRSFMQRAREIRRGEIREGRVHHTHETQPTNTQRTSLHKGK